MPLETQSLLTFSFTIEWTVIQQGWLKVDMFIQMAVACSTSGKPFSSPLYTAFLPCAISLQTNSCPGPWASFCVVLCRGYSNCSTDFILWCLFICLTCFPAAELMMWEDRLYQLCLLDPYVPCYHTQMFIDWMAHKCFVSKCWCGGRDVPLNVAVGIFQPKFPKIAILRINVSWRNT